MVCSPLFSLAHGDVAPTRETWSQGLGGLIRCIPSPIHIKHPHGMVPMMCKCPTKPWLLVGGVSYWGVVITVIAVGFTMVRAQGLTGMFPQF